jgi:hypothetical protein
MRSTLSSWPYVTSVRFISHSYRESAVIALQFLCGVAFIDDKSLYVIHALVGNHMLPCALLAWPWKLL